jgi:hypothetical protein
MPKLRDLYPVGDDEDVAALALYRHLHCGHCCPVKTNSDSMVRPLNAHKTGAASRWIGLFQGERRCEVAPSMGRSYSQSVARLSNMRREWGRFPCRLLIHEFRQLVARRLSKRSDSPHKPHPWPLAVGELDSCAATRNLAQLRL